MCAARVVAVGFLIVALTGCATGSQVPDYFADELSQPNTEIRKIALVTDLTPPELISVKLGSTHGEGAAAGAGAGALAGLRGLAEAGGSCSGEFCGVAFLLLLPVFVLGGAIVGAIGGAAGGYSADALAEAHADARAALDTGYLQVQVLERSQAYARDNVELQFIRTPWADPDTLSDESSYEALSQEGIDTVLEVELVRVALEDALQMEARARLVSANDGTVLSDGRYDFISHPRELEQWLEDNATPLQEAIEQGLQTLAEEIVDEMFLLYHPSSPREPRRPRVPYYVLAPEYPPIDSCGLGCASLFYRYDWSPAALWVVTVDSITPTFRWERFPRSHDLENASGVPGTISDVRYDLRVLEAMDRTPEGLIVPGKELYRANNLPDAEHRISPLPPPTKSSSTGFVGRLVPCTRYFWSVRARFELDGRTRVTEWSGAFDHPMAAEQKPWNLRRGVKAFPPMAPNSRPDPQWFYFPFTILPESGWCKNIRREWPRGRRTP